MVEAHWRKAANLTPPLFLPEAPAFEGRTRESRNFTERLCLFSCRRQNHYALAPIMSRWSTSQGVVLTGYHPSSGSRRRRCLQDGQEAPGADAEENAEASPLR